MRLVRKLGDGSAVEAFLGADRGRHYLVQVSRAALPEAWLGRLLDRTTDLATAAAHPELLTASALQLARGRLLAITEPVTGWTARDYLARVGRVPEHLVLDWGVALCEALHALHERGQVHGCLAPRHVHLSGTTDLPTAKLFDTALLHLRAPDASLAPPREACVVESEYLSPERASGSRGLKAADVWGLGALLAELLTGQAPFRGHSRDESRELARRSRAPKLPAGLARFNPVLAGCLEPLPQNRFTSALEVRQALLQAC
jgi:serine/threonine-protein kinase